MNKKNAFTLIELLVVIAIIAILAAVVLVSLSGAQRRANDARVTSALNQFRTRAILLNDMQGNYSGVDCVTDDELVDLCTDIEARNDVPAGARDLTVETTANTFCTYSQLPGSDQFWCVDSELHSKEYATEPNATCVSGCTSCLCE